MKECEGMVATTEEAKEIKKAEEEKDLKDREKRFYDDPFSFIELKELLVGAVLTDEGKVATLINPAKRVHLEIAQSRINFRINERIMRMEVEEARKNNKIITPGAPPKGGMMNFARRKR